MSGWNWNMADAPKDRPILAKCREGCDSDFCAVNSGGTPNLCLYHAHAEGLSGVVEGPHVIVWGGGWADSWEDGGGSLPDWWFQFGSEFEIAANPVAWMEIPDDSNDELTALAGATWMETNNA